ncbi:uncharacterized protein LOC124305404 [Neodiprion virginianus]|uniref:uncharacterized protein LOC124305404 n=1 Tax=Neodiprion virginianus TaxID=2961670 RepID=UPI001EE76BCD|nr:uncharacterized protein LOC124305404 [Neodiprion virginianus]
MDQRSNSWSLAAFACLLLLMMGASSSSSANDYDDTGVNFPTGLATHCPGMKPQASLDLEQITGKWYVVEYVEHKMNPMRPTSSSRGITESCPVVRLRFTGSKSLTIRLLWSTQDGDLDYSFTVTDPSGAPGLWRSRDLQNGTLVNKNYVHFVGIVQVMKAVASHMVLTFCTRSPNNELYSVVLSRNYHLTENDRAGVQSLLSRRLPMISVTETCVNIVENGNDSINTVNFTRSWWSIILPLFTLLIAASTYTTTI